MKIFGRKCSVGVVLCVGFILMAVVTYPFPPLLVGHSTPARDVGVAVVRGRIYVFRIDGTIPRPQFQKPGWNWGFGRGFRPTGSYWEAIESTARGFLGIEFAWGHGWYAHVHSLLFALLCGIRPAERAVRRVRDLLEERRVRRMVAEKRCTGCGYDLRATPGRCPECGEVPGLVG